MSASVFSRRGTCFQIIVFAVCLISSGAGMGTGSELTLDDLSGKTVAGSGESGPSLSVQDPSDDQPLLRSAFVTSSSAASPAPSGGAFPQSSINHFQVDPVSGSGSIVLAIDTPPGRGGMKPEMVLSYSPRGGNGPLGLGWSLDFGFIERSIKNGIPAFDDTDTFICSLGGGAAELVPVGEGRYQPKTESSFLYIQKTGETWTVKDRSGRTYFFGLKDVLQDESVLSDGARIFRWRLSEVRDISGNFYFIKYLKDGAFEIYFTGEPGTSRDGLDTPAQNFYARVTAELEDVQREDRLLNYRSGIEQRVDKRVKAVHIHAAGALQKRYVFDYEYSQRSGVSLLKQVRIYGSDGVTALPPITFSYEQAPVQYSLLGTMDDPLQGDRRWSFRYNAGYDRGHNNYGPVPPGHMMPLSSPTAASSWNKFGSWSQDDAGRIDLKGIKDTGYYFSTYLYVKKPVTLKLSYQSERWNPGFWLNGDYAQTRGAEWNLKAGYNLVEYTDYHQHAPFQSKCLTKISDAVDLMSSVQVILPQLAGDFNGDGVTDLATHFPDSGRVLVALSTGSAFLPKEEWLSGIPKDSRVLLGDFNGDGRTDIAVVDPSAGKIEVALSDGARLMKDGVWIDGFGKGALVAAGDFNGDGYTDLVSLAVSGTDQQAGFAMNTRSGGFSAIDTIAPVAGGKTDTVLIADLNGDGLSDFLAFNKKTGSWSGRLNTGGPRQPFSAMPAVSGFGSGRSPVVFDFNGDGLSDIGYFDPGTRRIHYQLSRGGEFNGGGKVPQTFGFETEDVQVQTGDFNGDGIMDMILYNQIGNIEIAYSEGAPADLLVEVSNGIGGVTSIAYVLSNSVENHYLPFVLPLVSSVTVSNSRGRSVSVRYGYQGGFWDPVGREFYGFQTVRVFDPDDHYTETHFLQDDIFVRGRTARQSFFTKSRRLMHETVHQWQKGTLYPDGPQDVQFVYLKRSDHFSYDQDGQGKRTAVEYAYDEPVQLGNMTAVTEYGEVDLETGEDIGGDMRRMEMSYRSHTDPDVWLIGQMTRQAFYVPNERDYRSQTVFFYEGDGGTADGSRGLLRSVRRLNEGFEPEFIEESFSYDMYGNITGKKSGESETVLQYDPLYHLFVTSTTDSLGQQSFQTYYGVNSEGFRDDQGNQGLFGQMESQTAVNSARTFHAYDVLGRPRSVTGPLDSQAYPGQKIRYDIFSDHSRVVSERRLEYQTDKIMKTVEFFDGLGNLIQTKHQPDYLGKCRVSGETAHDPHGRVRRVFLPRAASQGQYLLEEIPAGTPHIFISYDEAGRPVSSVNPDGSFSTVSYSLWETVSINVNGHQQRSYFDAFGNLVRKEECTGADGRSSLYPASAFQVYAATRYFYDHQNALTKTMDGHGNTTEIIYDRLGRKIGMNDPDMGYWTYGYDHNGNMIWQIDAKGQRTDFTYDALNRLVSKRSGQMDEVIYTYKRQHMSCGGFDLDKNADGKLCMIQYDQGTAENSARFFYDALGREVQTIKVIDGVEYRVRREYNALNNIKALYYPDGTAVYYEYDGTGRLDQIGTDPDASQSRTHPEDPLLPGRVGMDVWARLVHWYGTWFEPYVLGITPVNAAENEISIDSCRELHQPGMVYLLKRDLFGSDVKANCMTVVADNVTLDCQGRTISNNNLRSALVRSTREGTVVQNCILSSYRGTTPSEAGASFGILLDGNNGILRKNIIRQAGTGIHVSGSGNLITDNLAEKAIKGIHVRNGSNLVKNNLTRHHISADGIGIAISDAVGNQLLNNRSYANKSGIVLSNAGNTVVRCVWSDGNMAQDLYVYNRSHNVTVSGRIPPRRVVAPDSSVTLSPDSCADIECVWGVNACIPVDARPEIFAPPAKRALTGEVMSLTARVVDANRDTIAIDYDKSSLPEGMVLETVSSGPGWLDLRMVWKPYSHDIGRHTVVLAVSDGKHAVQAETVVTVVRGPQTRDLRFYVPRIAYTLTGQIDKIVYGNGTVKQYTYDSRTLRLKRIHTVNQQGRAVQDLNYDYDSAGNIITVTDRLNDVFREFRYDHLNRLVEARADGADGIHHYRYDEIGNLLEKDGKVYTYGYASQGCFGQCRDLPHAVASLNDGSFFEYDANGNMTRSVSGRGDFLYIFDADNRLKSVQQGGKIVAEFRYDGDGGRTQKIARAALSGMTAPVMAYPELVQHGAGAGDLVTHFVGKLYEVNNFHKTKHVYLGDALFLSVQDGQEQYIHGDHLGSAAVVEDQHGDLIQTNEYHPFGTFSRKVFHAEPGQGNSRYFTDQVLDEESGLYYYGSRYYDPVLGRFISADSIVPDAENPQALNRYTYVYNSPLCYTDPSGHFAWFVPVIIGAAIGGITSAVISHNRSGSVSFKSVAWGAFAGALSGGTLATPAAALGSFGSLMHVSASLSLGAQVAGAAGWGEGAHVMQQTAAWTGLAFLGWNVGLGVRDWAVGKMSVYDMNGVPSELASGDTGFVNGINSDLKGAVDKAQKLNLQNDFLISKVVHNPSSGLIADFTEAFLQKITFTSSVDRQLAGMLAGLNKITLVGHSQGSLIASNTLFNLGLRDSRNSVVRAHFFSAPLTQPRVFISAAVGGVSGRTEYGNNLGDPINLVGPNINPGKFLSGAAFQLKNH